MGLLACGFVRPVVVVLATEGVEGALLRRAGLPHRFNRPPAQRAMPALVPAKSGALATAGTTPGCGPRATQRLDTTPGAAQCGTTGLRLYYWYENRHLPARRRISRR